MGSLNKVMLIGRLGNDPEKKTTQSGSTVTNLSLATSENYKDKQGNKQEKTTWHKIILWNKLADLAEQYLSKGKQIYIEGSLGTNEWTDNDGNKRYSTEITAHTMQFLDAKDSQSSNNQRSPEPKKKYSERQRDKDYNPLTHDIGPDDIEDSIPF